MNGSMGPILAGNGIGGSGSFPFARGGGWVKEGLSPAYRYIRQPPDTTTYDRTVPKRTNMARSPWINQPTNQPLPTT